MPPRWREKKGLHFSLLQVMFMIIFAQVTYLRSGKHGVTAGTFALALSSSSLACRAVTPRRIKPTSPTAFELCSPASSSISRMSLFSSLWYCGVKLNKGREKTDNCGEIKQITPAHTRACHCAKTTFTVSCCPPHCNVFFQGLLVMPKVNVDKLSVTQHCHPAPAVLAPVVPATTEKNPSEWWWLEAGLGRN